MSYQLLIRNLERAWEAAGSRFSKGEFLPQLPWSYLAHAAAETSSGGVEKRNLPGVRGCIAFELLAALLQEGAVKHHPQRQLQAHHKPRKHLVGSLRLEKPTPQLRLAGSCVRKQSIPNVTACYPGTGKGRAPVCYVQGQEQWGPESHN